MYSVVCIYNLNILYMLYNKDTYLSKKYTAQILFHSYVLVGKQLLQLA